MTLITLSYLSFPLLSRHLMHVLLLGFMSRAQESFTPFRLVLLSLQLYGESNCASFNHVFWIIQFLSPLSSCLCVSLTVFDSQYVCLSFRVCLSFSACLDVCLSFSLSLFFSICLPLLLSVCLFLCLFFCLSLYLSVYVCLCLSLSLSLSVSFCLSVCLALYLFLFPTAFRCLECQCLKTTKTGKKQWNCCTRSL